MEPEILSRDGRPTHQNTLDERIPVTAGRVYSLSAGLTGGLLGGLAMALFSMVQSALLEKSIWYPANLTAAVLLRGFQGASEAQLLTFSLEGFVVGALIHFAISAGIGLLFTLLLPGIPGNPVFWGVVLSPVLWIIGYLTLSLLNPIMYQYVEPVGFAIGHVLFGLLLGLWVTWREGQGSV